MNTKASATSSASHEASARAPVILYYDEDCPLCVSLAGFVKQRSKGKIQIESCQQTYHNHDDCTAVMIGVSGERYHGEEVWRWLLANVKDLRSLNWLAQRLGLERHAARGLERGAGILKRICRRCGRASLH